MLLQRLKKLALSFNLSRAIAFILRSLIIGLRPLLGATTCYFKPTCTPYAIAQLQEKPLLQAIWLITKRLLACSPLTYKLIKTD